MTTADAAAAFADFRGAVLDDYMLAVRMMRSLDLDAFTAQAVAAGAARGFHFDGTAVRAAFRDAEAAW